MITKLTLNSSAWRNRFLQSINLNLKKTILSVCRNERNPARHFEWAIMIVVLRKILNAKRNLLVICLGFDDKKAHLEKLCLKEQISPQHKWQIKTNILPLCSKWRNPPRHFEWAIRIVVLRIIPLFLVDSPKIYKFGEIYNFEAVYISSGYFNTSRLLYKEENRQKR